MWFTRRYFKQLKSGYYYKIWFCKRFSINMTKCFQTLFLIFLLYCFVSSWVLEKKLLFKCPQILGMFTYYISGLVLKPTFHFQWPQLRKHQIPNRQKQKTLARQWKWPRKHKRRKTQPHQWDFQVTDNNKRSYHIKGQCHYDTNDTGGHIYSWTGYALLE